MPANGALFTIAFIGITYGRGKAAWKAEDQTIVEKLCSWLSTIVQGVSTLMIAAALIPEFDHLSRHVEGNPAWEKATMFGELRTATALYGASMALVQSGCYR